MKIDVLTLFPAMFAPITTQSILGRAVQNGTLDIALHDIRDYSRNKHKTADDYPYGGGAGMVMLAQPVLDCMNDVIGQSKPLRIYMSPRGKVLTNDLAKELAKEEHLLILCGHYEGIDERIMTQIDEQISIGDYVLTGGEIPAMALIDCVSRFVPEVLGHEDSAHDESFSHGLLEYPQYTRPASYNGMDIPDVLLSGNHANIQKWRRKQQLLLTLANRPDLLKDIDLSDEEHSLIHEIIHE